MNKFNGRIGMPRTLDGASINEAPIPRPPSETRCFKHIFLRRWWVSELSGGSLSVLSLLSYRVEAESCIWTLVRNVTFTTDVFPLLWVDITRQ